LTKFEKLFIAEGHDGVDFGGAAGGEVTGYQTDGKEEGGGSKENRWIYWGNSIRRPRKSP